MTIEQAEQIIIELLNVAAKRGAYSSIEINAINEALIVLNIPNQETKSKVNDNTA